MPKQEAKNTLMQEFEHFTDHIIPYLVLLLAAILIMDNPLWTLVDLHDYEPWVTVVDGVIVFFFVVDLLFKWEKTKNIRSFLRLYWLDIVAVFPFYLGFRAYTELAGILLAEEVAEAGQKVAHEAVLLREAKLAREARVAGRGIRMGQRFLRFFRGRFYASHKALLAIHAGHKKSHKSTSLQSRPDRSRVPKRN